MKECMENSIWIKNNSIWLKNNSKRMKQMELIIACFQHDS
jgi:hypothetical protein